MLSVGVGGGGRTGGGGGGGGGGGRNAVAPWHSPASGRPFSRDPGISIKQKISQWEGRSQQEEGQGVKVRGQGTPVSRTLSGDVLGNGVCGDGRSCEPRSKASLAKAKSLGLDFRENQARCGHGGAGRKLDLQQNHKRLDEVENLSPTPSPVSAPMPNLTSDPVISPAAKTDSSREIMDISIMEADSPSLSAEDPGSALPPGNFYTSRGFWRRLEGEESLWNREEGDRAGAQSPRAEDRGLSLVSSPPPKPQRTFQYRGADSPPGHWCQWENWAPPASQSQVKTRASGPPPSCPPPPCPVTHGNGLSRHKKNRKSFEFEDVVQLTGQQGAVVDEGRRSGLYHTLSEDNIYEDIISDQSRENPYEDVKLAPVGLLRGRSVPWTVAQRRNPCTPKLPPKPLTLRMPSEKVEKQWNADRKEGFKTATPTSCVPPSRPGPPKRCAAGHKTCRLPPYVNKIQEIFSAKRGWKRVRNQRGDSHDGFENSGTESDPEESSKGENRRSVYVQSTLRRRPGYRTLERDLIQLQQQQLFQLFVVVSLRKSSPGNTYSPEITQQFPNKFEKSSRLSREAEDRLKAIPKFCFPDSLDWRPSADFPSETFSFVLTGEDGSRWFGYCRKILPSGKGKRLPEVHCIVSRLGCFNLFAKVLEEVERRREISPALVYPFMRSVMEAPFPAPGRTVTVKSFLPGSGNEVLTLCRPVDSRLEHVDFECLLQCLSVGQLLQVFASLVLERRVIFIADKLSTLSRCAHTALALLYPFTWQHTFVPVLPASMLDISCSPTPFLMGALSPCLPQLLDLPIEEVLIVDLCADRFVKQLGDEDCILPNKLQAALHQILEQRVEILGQDEGQNKGGEESSLSSLVSEAFVRFFVELVGHYSLHMEAACGSRELQREAFRKSHPSRGARQFLQLFMDTQMFAGFIQDRELRKGGVKGLFEVRAAEYLASNPEPEPSGVNKFLKGLGHKMKFLQKK
ncbi:DENN domain-containing protein 2C [Megalops cyprinoides]|uniref:DENN domain-containing protein 2C n=1 Tax=Megalops cyprinoides TaxID=118141 RepID=UPI001864DF50|nr:DENN domain-containing protein 2C [Megalops cyprinoides]